MSSEAFGHLRIAVLGCGSIGRRHIGNLLRLGIGHVVGIDPDPQSRSHVESEHETEAFADLSTSLLERFDAVVVATPSSFHYEQTRNAVEHGRHVFVEKPLATSLDGLEKLIASADRNNVVGFVGSNFKFHPSFQRMKQIIDDGLPGRITSARCQFGSYLPDWRPATDYRKTYSARAELGGGILLDSHEFDYMTWFLGPADLVSCFCGHISSLETDTEDTAAVIMRMSSGAIVDMHLDNTQRAYQRNFEFFGEAGTLIWSMQAKAVSLYIAEKKEWTEWKEPADYDLNLMYVEEMRHFLECIVSNGRPISGLRHGARVVRTILAAKESAQSGKAVDLR